MDKPKLQSELALVRAACEEKEIKYLNWYKTSEGMSWKIDTVRGVRCSAIATAVGSFTRLVQDPFAEVTRVAR